MMEQQQQVPENSDKTADDAIAEMTDEIKTLAKDHRKMKERLEQMAIFCKRTSAKGGTKERAEVDYLSTPEEELFFEHRRLYEQQNELIQQMKEKIREIPGNRVGAAGEIWKILQKIQQFQNSSFHHLSEMKEILQQLREQLSAKEQRMITITQERARLMQSDAQHRDKMELARDGDKRPTITDLKQRLALKHNVPVEQIDQILQAKPVEIELQR
jgi:hypothetical protein